MLVFRKFTRLMMRVMLVGAVLLSLLAGWQWFASEHHSLYSRALQEDREYQIFNPNSDGPVIYALDGQNIRNGLAPAVIFSLASLPSGQDLPKIVAVSSNENRDRDFRPLESTPTYWRPTISGHSPDFDTFLLRELLPKVEAKGTIDHHNRYLMGHSLAGLYALDLGTRENGVFSGIFAFAPTFSHDTSIVKRLPSACNPHISIYANWGLESTRDTAVFNATVNRWKDSERCEGNNPIISNHYGSIHQTIMLTGQIHVAFMMF